MKPALARAARAILGWTMEDLARRSRVAKSTVQDYENGKRTPNRLTRFAFATAFEEAGIEFIGGDEKAPGILVHRSELLD